MLICEDIQGMPRPLHLARETFYATQYCEAMLFATPVSNNLVYERLSHFQLYDRVAFFAESFIAYYVLALPVGESVDFHF